MAETIHSVERVLGLIEVLAAASEGSGVGSLARESGLPPSTVHRMLSVLCRAGYARQEVDTDRYVLTPRIFEIGCLAVDRLDLRSIGQQHLRQLRADTCETAHLCILDDDTALCIDRAVSENVNRIDPPVGYRNPLHSTAVGKVFLAFGKPEETAQWISRLDLKRYTPHTTCSPGELRTDVRTTSEQGYAVDWDENELGIRCIAAPVFDHAGSLVAALGISGPSVRLTDVRREALARSVIDAAEAFSKDLGYRGALVELQRRR